MRQSRAAGWAVFFFIEIKHYPFLHHITKAKPVKYSLRSELVVAKMVVSRIKIGLDTSIPSTSNLERRE